MEILIHVSAPSTAQHDAQYQAQAAAILNFQPATVLSSPDFDFGDSATREQSAVPSEVQPPRSIATTIGSASQDSLISVIPDSHPFPHEAPEKPPKRCRIESTLPAASHSGLSPSPISSHARAPVHVEKELELELEQELELELGRERLKPITITPFPISSQNPKTNPNTLLPFLPLELHSPPPPISTSSFTTHITETLSMLTTHLNPSRTYKPLQQTRSLHQLERGHWVLRLTIQPDTTKQTNSPGPGPDSVSVSAASRNGNAENTGPGRKLTEDWSLSTFHRFWSFLAEFIGNGRAGWGVWCVLEHVPVERSGSGSETPSSIRVQLKVYAWGEIAMHVYLLLFLASERRVRRMGVCWRDSGEEVVIQMP